MAKRFLSMLLAFILLTGAVPAFASADPLDAWTLRSPYPTSDLLTGVAYGNGTFVALGVNDAVLTSNDGAAWTNRSIGANQLFMDVAFGGGAFAAVRLDGQIMTSIDGASWTPHSTGLTNGLSRIAYGDGMFVAVGGSGTIMTSSDNGGTWTNHSVSLANDFWGIAFGNHTFIAVGGGGAIYVSQDGEDWTPVSSGLSDSVILYEAAYGNDRFVAVGSGGAIVASSDDGATWSSLASGTSNDLNSVIFDRNTFAAVGAGGTILTSDSGADWTVRSSGTANSLYSIGFGNGTFVATGQSGTIRTSSDGVTWIGRNIGTGNSLTGIAYGNGALAAVGIIGTLMTSRDDGATWIARDSGTTQNLEAISYGNNTFVAVGYGGTILTSDDGVSWTSRTSGTNYEINGVGFVNHLFVAVGSLGLILTSSDGIAWTPRNSNTDQDLFDVSYGNDTFVAVGSNGTVVTSPDGFAWSSQRSVAANGLYGVSFGNGIFAAVGGTGGASTILTSVDGTTWTRQSSGTRQLLLGVKYLNGLFLAEGYGGTLLTSDDGITWSAHSTGTAAALGDIGYIRNTYVLVGELGTILQAASADADLTDLSLSQGALAPSFSTGTTDYTASVGAKVTSTTVTASVYESHASLTMNVFDPANTKVMSGVGLTSGQPSPTIPLAAGNNRIEVTVKAQDGRTSKTYAINVSRSAEPNVGRLGSLNLRDKAGNAITLSPAFQPGTVDYSANVVDSVAIAASFDEGISVTMSAYAPSNASIADPVSLTSGQPSSPVPLEVGTSRIELTATARDGLSQTYTVNVTRAEAPQPPPSNPIVPAGPAYFKVYIDGDPQDRAATASLSAIDNRDVLTVSLDPIELSARLAKAGDRPTVLIPTEQPLDGMTVAMTGATVKALEQKQALLVIQSPNGSYELPAIELAIDRIAGRFAEPAELSDIGVRVTIAKGDSSASSQLDRAAAEGKFTVIAPPVDFTIDASSNGQTFAVDGFSRFVERELPLPERTEPGKTITAAALNDNGTIRPVPTRISVRDGRTYAAFGSLTNSTYALIGRSAAFADLEGHWSEGAVNDLAARMVVQGVDGTHYAPDAAVTRAEFAAIVARALGLPDSGNSPGFADIHAGDWYFGPVSEVQAYGLMEGYEDGSFQTNRTIKREEAMAILARAMKLAGLQANVGEEEARSVLSRFADGHDVDAWAVPEVAAVVSARMANGFNDRLLPASNVTRAESAALVQRMLVGAKLIAGQ